MTLLVSKGDKLLNFFFPGHKEHASANRLKHLIFTVTWVFPKSSRITPVNITFGVVSLQLMEDNFLEVH